MNEEYDYEKAGFDGFLSRNDKPMVNLNSDHPPSNQIAYDRVQVTGPLGDTLQIGQVHINKTNITLSDGITNRLLIGEDREGF